MALVHGGASFRIFCPSVYHFLCGRSASDIIALIDEVPNPDTRAVLKDVIIIYKFEKAILHIFF